MSEGPRRSTVPLSTLLEGPDAVLTTLDHLSEAAQTDRALLALLHSSGVVPGAEVLARREGDRLVLRSGERSCAVEGDIAHLFFVVPSPPAARAAEGNTPEGPAVEQGTD